MFCLQTLSPMFEDQTSQHPGNHPMFRGGYQPIYWGLCKNKDKLKSKLYI